MITYLIVGGIALIITALFLEQVYRSLYNDAYCRCETCMSGDLVFGGDGDCLWLQLEAFFNTNGEQSQAERARKIADLYREFGCLVNECSYSENTLRDHVLGREIREKMEAIELLKSDLQGKTLIERIRFRIAAHQAKKVVHYTPLTKKACL